MLGFSLQEIDWARAVAQGIAGGAAMLVVLVTWAVLRALIRGLAWLFYPDGKRAARAERAALTELLSEAEQRGYRRGWRAAIEARQDEPRAQP